MIMIAASKPSMSSNKCLSDLIENLRKISYSLSMLYQDNLVMRNKILRACGKFLACQEAVVQPALTLTNVISDLQMLTTQYDQKYIAENMFVDRQFHSNRDQKSQSKC